MEDICEVLSTMGQKLTETLDEIMEAKGYKSKTKLNGTREIYIIKDILTGVISNLTYHIIFP